MTKQASQHTRREVLTWLASIPFLPLGAMATSAALVGCNDNNDSAVINPINPIKLKSATFTPMPAPTMVAVMATTACTSKLSITWDDGSKTDYQLGYKPFFLTGTKGHEKAARAIDG